MTAGALAEAGSLTDVGWAVVIAAAVLVSGVALRATGRWLARAIGRDFHAAVREAAGPDLEQLKESVAAMRAEQTEQHGQVRAQVAGLAARLDTVDTRLANIEAGQTTATKG